MTLVAQIQELHLAVDMQGRTINPAYGGNQHFTAWFTQLTNERRALANPTAARAPKVAVQVSPNIQALQQQVRRSFARDSAGQACVQAQRRRWTLLHMACAPTARYCLRFAAQTVCESQTHAVYVLARQSRVLR